MSGQEAYDSRLLLCLLFYGYSIGTFSSRKIEQATYNSIPIQIMIALPILENVSFLKYQLSLYRYSIAQEAGLLKVEKVSLKLGTKNNVVSQEITYDNGIIGAKDREQHGLYNCF